MAFTDGQMRLLKAKLDPRFIKTRNANGVNLSYVEGWHAIAEANRIFGFDAWDRRTISTACVWNGQSGQLHSAAYTAKVRVSVRAGDIVVVREGSGTGEGRASTAGQAHELALKGAETDATKRALATFGNSFGLALYDREQAGVRKLRSGSNGQAEENSQLGPWVLHSSGGKPISTHEASKTFIEALKQAMSEADDIELLYDVWEQNIETLRVLHRSTNELRWSATGPSASTTLSRGFVPPSASPCTTVSANWTRPPRSRCTASRRPPTRSPWEPATRSAPGMASSCSRPPSPKRPTCPGSSSLAHPRPSTQDFTPGPTTSTSPSSHSRADPVRTDLAAAGSLPHCRTSPTTPTPAPPARPRK